MINSFQRANIMAIQNQLALQLVSILLDVVVFRHNYHHINLGNVSFSLNVCNHQFEC